MDQDLVREHLELAKNYGIDGFAVSWWGIGSYEDQVFKEILDESNGFKSCIYYETNRGSPPLTPDLIASELNFILENYGVHENYLKQDETPVIMIFNADGYDRDKFWADIRSRIHYVFLIGDFRDKELVEVFDGLHIYYELNPERHREVTSWISEQNIYFQEKPIKEIINASKNSAITYLDKLTVGTVSPRYNDTKVRLNGASVERLGSETYRNSWETVCQYDLEWALITSWNEWHEGTEIEPSRENGYTALNETRRQVKLFKED